MSKQFIQMTSGWIPVSVMVLLAIALIAGQARANLPHEAKVSPLSASTAVSISLDAEMLRKFELLPAALEHLLARPFDIELSIDFSDVDFPNVDIPSRQEDPTSDAASRHGSQ